MVPNAPCGVESWFLRLRLKSFLFCLMHRVELKGGCLVWFFAVPLVPNAPCGVESFKRRREALSLQAVLSQLFRMQTVGGGKGLNS